MTFKHPLAWDPNQLWNKALTFIERSSAISREDPAASLNSCLALELLARAALTAIHPALNADPQSEGSHILYACGIEARVSPKSIPVHAVFARLASAYPDFKPHVKVCEYLITLRNEELHTGSLPFENVDETNWLADYYAAVQFLCSKLGKELSEYIGAEAEHAGQLIAGTSKARTGEILKRIAAQRTIFDSKTAAEKDEARKAADESVRFRSSRTIQCPACGNKALLSGERLMESRPEYSEGELTVSVTFATSSLKCTGCGLHLKTMDECLAGKVKPRFIEQETTDLHELHQDEQHLEYDNM